MNGHQPPNRLKYAVILALGLGASQVAGAVGLGPIIGVNSHLGQPLSASIRVDGLSKEQAQRATITLGSAAEYRSRGIQRLPSHDQLRFKIVPAGNGHRIHVSSKNGIREPFVNFLLTISSDGEKVTREYALFLNPDPAGNIVPSAPAIPEPVEMPVVVTETAPVPVPVPVMLPRSTPATVSPTAAPRKDDGFIGQARPSQSDIIPASEEAEGWGVVSPGAQRVVLSAQNSTVAPKESTPAAAGGGGGTYGPVKAGETLYSIAAATRPASMSVNEMMRAIKRANPRAFSSSSMNSLMAGVTLVIPHGGGNVAAPVSAETAPVTESVAAAQAEKPRSRRSSRRKQHHVAQAPEQQATVETAPAPDAATPETPVGMEEGNVPMAMAAQTEAAPAPAETGHAADGMPAGEAPAEQASAGTENATPAPGMDTSLSLEGVDSVKDGDMAGEAQPEVPSGEMPPADMSAGGMTGGEPVASEAVPAEGQPEAAPVETVAATQSETAPAETQPAAGEPVQTPVEVPPAANEAVQAPVAQPVPASQNDASPLPFGLQVWHLAVAAGALLIGLLLAILMKARGRKKDIDSIEDMSPAEIDRMVAELENDESLQRSFHDDIDNLDDLSYEQLSREKASMEDGEQEIMKARLAELAELEALDKEENDDFDTLTQQAEQLPAFHPEKAVGDENISFFDDIDDADAKSAGHEERATGFFEDFDDIDAREEAEDVSTVAAAEETVESFEWDFSNEEPIVQTSAHEEKAEDFFNVNEPWPEIAEEAEAPRTAAEAAVPEADLFDFDATGTKPAAKSAPMQIVPEETEAEVSPEKIEAMEINLDLATSFIATGNAQRAKIWLDEVMMEGSAAQKALAAQLLKKIEALK
ncbi:MAG: FimV/HubP family polar landmark protein [Cardiobacteriaceae bacterium]|nr:FimV/HubP family polar landmark protein [Cardiobacteriaceae bacterium]